MKKELATASLFLAVAGAWALGQDDTTPSPSPSPTSSPTASPTATASPGATPTVTPSQQLSSAVALNMIHHVNTHEIQSSQNAQGRLQRQDVQQFAQTLITDHQASETQLQQVAQSENIDLLPFQPSTFEAAAENVLNTLSGSEFDQAFLEIQRQGHQRALQDLQAIQPSVTDAEVQQQVAQSITLIQGHLNQANQLIASPGTQPSPTSSPTESPTPSPSPTQSPGSAPGSSDGSSY